MSTRLDEPRSLGPEWEPLPPGEQMPVQLELFELSPRPQVFDDSRAAALAVRSALDRGHAVALVATAGRVCVLVAPNRPDPAELDFGAQVSVADVLGLSRRGESQLLGALSAGRRNVWARRLGPTFGEWIEWGALQISEGG